jgi:hypothetical protein
MLGSVFRDAYGVDFQTFRLWDLVPNEDLRQLLRDSEYALDKGYPAVCIVGCDLAHDLIIRAIRNSTKLRRFRASQVFSRSKGSSTQLPPGIPFEARSKLQQAARQMDSEIRKGVAQFRREIMEEIEFLEDEVVTIGVGMPLMDTRRFQKIGGETVVDFGYDEMPGAGDHPMNRNNEEAREGARFMLSYLSRLVRLIDETYPEVVRSIEVLVPLTSRPWWSQVEGENASPGAAERPA